MDELRRVVLSAVGPVEVTPGHTTDVELSLQNPDRVPRIFEVRPIGLAPSWAAPSITVGPIPPGERSTATLSVTLPVGFPACEFAAGLSVQTIDPAGNGPVGAAS